MSYPAQHARTLKLSRRFPARVVVRIPIRVRARLLGLAAVAGLGLAAAPAAHADGTLSALGASPDLGTVDSGTTQASTAQLGGVQLYPLAGTPLDLLSNSLRVPVGGMDVSTLPVTAPLQDGLPLREIPVVGTLLP